ncbi:hypothetical protein ASE39_05620 [Acidovorax sp. Root267]|uniref:hypothetical protein n=1 Tax=Acidovorax sp. Root267 TaxID=1736505 RepID=UPI00070E4FF8|nr:hypothetical protein [Acidovorax sp. Root267]KRD21877.1 hypothetical protein ASE39_05620 [Acidovorax sp. Root267]
MTHQAPAEQIPPEIARYLQGPASEAKQFDFLIGDWNVEASRYKEDGTPAFNYRALWSAKPLNEGRMIMDDFQALGPTGVPVSSFVTLRTYSEITKRWEIVGLQALQSAVPTEWHGTSKDGEMLLDAIATLPNGHRVHTKIRFFEIAPDSFAWESSMTVDQGNTWRKTASLKATRKT